MSSDGGSTASGKLSVYYILLEEKVGSLNRAEQGDELSHLCRLLGEWSQEAIKLDEKATLDTLCTLYHHLCLDLWEVMPFYLA